MGGEQGEDSVQIALNQMTVPGLGFGEFLDLAVRLGCMGVEARNDLERPLFDNAAPETAGQMVKDRGLRLVGLSQVYPFNDWRAEREDAVKALIETARGAGAESISLIPRNDGQATGNGERQANLRIALKAVLPLLRDAEMIALVEPLGFRRSSLRSKAELVETIHALEGEDSLRIVHDTFHHTLADGGPMFPELTGIVHISGVTDPDLDIDQMEDAHRVLVDGRDRLGNVAQIAALRAAGYSGPVSYECFAPEIHALADPYSAIRRSLDFISSELHALAA